ncbi:MAG: SMP-30/gluconolactonase/LRE family protein [SAR324 cluster bacterium]|nr:SMP-30/gluconolactonase/LRE family protein [SAR324 cluster bacterium]
METLASGYGLIEGPVWRPGAGLLFSDVIHGGVHCLPEDGGPVRTVIEHRRGIGGMALHESGGLIVSGRNIAHKPDGGGATLVLLDETAAPGVVGFNDITTDSEGRLYVGSLGFSPITPGAEQRPGYLHLIGLDGGSRVLATGIELTNGLGVSPDGRRLYHSDSRTHQVWQYERSDDGGLSPRTPFAEVSEGLADGLALSEDGAVWVAVADGGCVLVFNADGSRRERIAFPLPMVTSLCFGGRDMRDLYVVSGSRGSGSDRGGTGSARGGTGSARGGTVFRLRVEVPGLPVAPARVKLP